MMDHVLAHIKTRAKKRIFKLVSDQSLFDTVTIDLNACIPYNPDHNLDEDSWFKIEGFSQKEFCIELLKKDYDSKDYDDLTKDNFAKIAYLFAIQGNDFYFQKITPSLFVKRKTLVFGEAAEIEKSQTRLVLMNPLMILVKIIKLRWIHILSYDQMVSRKINNQTTRCANSIF
ncbi:hypothetical protein ABK655_19335, partial [Morganella morganii]